MRIGVNSTNPPVLGRRCNKRFAIPPTVAFKKFGNVRVAMQSFAAAHPVESRMVGVLVHSLIPKAPSTSTSIA